MNIILEMGLRKLFYLLNVVKSIVFFDDMFDPQCTEF